MLHRSLFGNCFLSLSQFLGVHQVVVVDGFHFFVEFKNKRNGSGYVVSQNLVVVHASELLNDGTDRVTMGNDNSVLAIHDLGADGVVPVRHHTVKGGGKGFRAGEGRWRQQSVAVIMHGVSLVAHFKLWGWDVVTASPLQDLLLSMLLSSLNFVKALEASVMALVESPGFNVGDVKLSHLSQDVVVSLNSALEDRGVSNIEFEVLLLQGLTSSDGFLDTVGSEVDVIPASESVL